MSPLYGLEDELGRVLLPSAVPVLNLGFVLIEQDLESRLGQVAPQGDIVPQGQWGAGVQREEGLARWDRDTAVRPPCPAPCPPTPSLSLSPLFPYSRCCALLRATSHQPARDTGAVEHRATKLSPLPA